MEWEKVTTDTYRMRVDGGYLYRAYGVGMDYVALCFVPDAPKTIAVQTTDDFGNTKKATMDRNGNWSDRG